MDSVTEQNFRKLADYTAGDFPPPFTERFAYALVEVAPGRVVMEQDVDAGYAHQWGAAFGGVVAALADATLGFVSLTTMEKGQTGGFLEMKINDLRPVTQTRLRAVGTVKRRGRTVALTQCDVHDADGEPVAFATATIAIRG